MIHNLPDEIILTILETLNPFDLTKCRLVCKRIKFVIDNFIRFNEFRFQCPKYKCEYYNKNKCLSLELLPEIRKNKVLLSFDANLMKSSSLQKLFSKIRRFEIISDFILKKQNLKFLNELTKLEILYIRVVQIPCGRDIFLEPISLKFLGFHSAVSYPLDHEVDNFRLHECSKLVVKSKIRKLIYHEDPFSVLELDHPELISSFEFYGSQFFFTNFFSFKNLKFLRLREPLDYFFEIFKKLEEVYIENHKSREFLQNLIDKKLRLKRFDLKIYYFNVLIDGKIEDYDTERFKVNEMHIKNYHHIADIIPYPQIYYSVVSDCLKDYNQDLLKRNIRLNEYLFPHCFFKRYRFIKRMHVDDIKDQKQLIWVLKQTSRTLLELIFEKKCVLNQQVINEIAESCRFLVFLSINSLEKCELDYQPLIKLKDIETISVPLETLNLEKFLATLLELFQKSMVLRKVYIYSYGVKSGMQSLTVEKPRRKESNPLYEFVFVRSDGTCYFYKKQNYAEAKIILSRLQKSINQTF